MFAESLRRDTVMTHRSPRSSITATILHSLWIKVLVSVSISIVGSVRLAHAATFTVNSTADSIDANLGDSACSTSTGVCTLRAAIMEANALVGADVIELPAGLYPFRIAGTGENVAASGDLDVTDNLSIVGAGATNTVI